MAQTRVAIRYAKAVLSLANEQLCASQVNDDMKTIVNAVKESKDLNEMLQSPVIHSKVKKATILKAFPHMNQLSIKLVDILIENKRINILDGVAQKINMLFDELQGTQLAKVTTAIPLTQELEAKVLTKVKELTGDDAEVENIIDESILGGFILRVGDIQYNASIANKLNKLKREFTLN